MTLKREDISALSLKEESLLQLFILFLCEEGSLMLCATCFILVTLGFELRALCC
jgi:hypothetical protein